MHIELSTADLLAHITELEDKARKYDALVNELELHVTHTKARATSYFNQAKSYGDNPTARDAILQEFAYGRGGAYNVAADDLTEILKGI